MPRMSHYNNLDPEELKICPYEKSHVILAKRFQYHLMKCRKNYTGRDYATCPFNARHEMPKPELRYHIANCPDKVMIEPNLAYEKSKNGEGTYFKGCTDVPDYDNYVPPSAENWDEEIPSVPRVGVDPSYFARLDNCMMPGMTPAQRKAMRKQYFLPAEDRRLTINQQQNNFEDEEEEVQEERLRLPQSAPKTYLSSENRPAQQPSTVFAYSLSMAGVGRGQPASNPRSSQVTPGSMNPDSSSRMDNNIPANLRGRGTPLAMHNPMTSNPVPANGVFSMGIGRGRGLMGMPRANGNPSFVMPHVGAQASSELLSEFTQNGSMDKDYSGTGSDNSEASDTVSREKERKKLQKKLRQIEILESKEKEGYKLTSEEMAKVKSKEEIKMKLQSFD